MALRIVAEFAFFGYFYVFKVKKINLGIGGINFRGVAAKFP
jgi:hypothetical protein